MIKMQYSLPKNCGDVSPASLVLLQPLFTDPNDYFYEPQWFSNYSENVKTPFIMVFFKRHLILAFSFQRLSKTVCSTLNSWIGEFLVSFFNITNRLIILIIEINKQTQFLEKFVDLQLQKIHETIWWIRYILFSRDTPILLLQKLNAISSTQVLDLRKKILYRFM